MTWSLHTSCGFESDKIKYEVLPYLTRGGLDIGCGPKKVWPHLIGIDSGRDTELFGVAMKPDIVVGTASRLPLFADASTDAVFSSHTLEHLDDWQAALAEWWRLVKVGGHLILYLPHRDLYPNIGEPGANPDHRHDFMPEDIIDGMRGLAADWTLLENQSRDHGNEYSFLQVYRKEAAGAGQRHAWAQPKPAKTAGIVRIGAKGDALWASSPAALLKEQGYHVTAFVATTGEEVLRHDPNIDHLVTLPNGVLTDEELLAFWAHQAAKFDRWVNLIGSVEQRLLYHPSSNEFFLPPGLRHRFGNLNYLEMVHDYAGLPHDFRQKYFPTESELAWARETREKLLPPGPLVVLNACGSGPAKTWPHAQAFLERMAAARIVTVVLGDVKGLDLAEVNDCTAIVGNEWPVRGALAFARIADAVVATESMIANSVAMEPMLKVVLLSHSSNENLTKHWKNTAALEAPGVSCHPCHRIHATLDFCAKDTATGCAACMASYGPDAVADFVIERLRAKEAA
jgi:predicted SAM-dependent methyltransferase/ADP-heptose:LPS heptosyltransferase